MRTIPVETTTLRLVASGAAPVAVNRYADGVRTGDTVSDDKGRALVRVDLFVLTDEGAEAVRVKVPVTNCPKELTTLAPVMVTGLVATPYLNGSRVAVAFRAESVVVAK